MPLTAAIVRGDKSILEGWKNIAKVMLGFSSRAWGLTLDTIVGLGVVLANGSFVHASSSSYSDVYWVEYFFQTNIGHTE